MAFPRFLSLLTTVTLSLFLTTTDASSRSLSTSPKTTVLDVVSSLQQTQTILSLDPTRSSLTTTKPESISDPVFFNSSSPLSLELHSRDTFVASQHKDYKSLVLSRLERDSSRVAGIAAKIRIAVEGIDRSDLKPVNNEDTRYQPEALTTPVVSGVSQGSGEYFSRIGVGTPAKEMYLVLDTGSDVNWIQCEPCSDCYQQSDPVFNPTSSSTYKSLTCTAPQCSLLETSACRSNKCLYQVSYGDGSFTVGELATDTVTFGNSGKINDVALGCGHDNEGLFTGAAGLLGLGGGALSITNQMKATSFSYCLVDRDSGKSSSLDFNSVQLGSGDATAPLLRNQKIDTFYYVGLSGFSVGGQKVIMPDAIFDVDASGSGGVILDCGTAVTRLQTQAYNSLRDAFLKLTTNLKKGTSSISLFDTCYDFSSLSSVKVPTVAFHFTGGKSLDLPAKNYLIPVDDNGTFCFAFAPTSSSLSIIGNVQQQGTRITYDLANKIIGLSGNKC
ncbi:Xylanase inhibitor N-terminal [Arabidopsis thaliana x Arabidopsis arenosa]|uniref:Xylanase inhibitor N-terminal n=1 Tax=Arabidopsis thaliana x Arabidopsis arenosa TaxID=1240361 RepID=A0A8T2AT07_9BRAS|nr:Xylanase inhibitor N-terminal [Arabidopsis thaliana x Arabidopsis arenosa]